MYLKLSSVVGLGLLFCQLAGCGPTNPSGPPAGAGGGGPRAANVLVDLVVEQEVTPETIVVGTVTARKTSVVASGAEGKVDEFLVREGDVVQKGQPLSLLNMVTTDLGIAEAQQVLEERQQALMEVMNGSRKEEIAEAQARMEAARVTRDIAAEKLSRSQRLASTGAANQDDLDDARERAEAADRMFEAALAHFNLVNQGSRAEAKAQAKARLEAQHSQVDNLIAEKAKRTTLAPFPGVVVQEHTESGQWLSKGDPVVTVADLLEEVYVIANVDQRDLPNVQIGVKVAVEIEAAAQKQWEGTVLSIVPRSAWESGSRTFPVKVAIRNQTTQAGEKTIPMLTEGMYARVTFSGRSRIARLVPKNAIIRSEIGSKVFAVLEQDGLKVRPVMLHEGGAFGDKVEVVGDVLQIGEKVVTEGAERLSPFAAINIVSRAAGPPGTTPSDPAAK